MSELAEIRVESRDGVPVASVDGEIDLSNADSTLEALRAAVEPGAPGLVVDLTGLDYLDSAGVRIFFRLSQAAGESGGVFRAVVPAGAQIRRVLELANVENMLPLDETVEGALAAVHAR